jgi:hypothetical protein
VNRLAVRGSVLLADNVGTGGQGNKSRPEVLMQRNIDNLLQRGPYARRKLP